MSLNPVMDARAHQEWAKDQTNLPGILAGADLAMDCLDNMSGRYDLEQACALAGIPYIHGALAGWEGFVMTVRPGDPGIRGLYGPNLLKKAMRQRCGWAPPLPPRPWSQLCKSMKP